MKSKAPRKKETMIDPKKEKEKEKRRREWWIETCLGRRRIWKWRATSFTTSLKHVICTPPPSLTSSLKTRSELISSFKASTSGSSRAIIKFNYRTQKLSFCKGLEGKVINSVLTQIRNYTIPQQWTGHDSSIAQFKPKPLITPQ